MGTAILELLAPKNETHCSEGMHCLSAILASMFSIETECSTSRATVLPASTFAIQFISKKIRVATQGWVVEENTNRDV